MEWSRCTPGRRDLLRIAAEVSTYDEEVRALWFDIAERFIAATDDHIRSEQDLGLIPRTLEPRSTAESLFWMAERCCYVYLGRERADAEAGGRRAGAGLDRGALSGRDPGRPALAAPA